MAAKNKNRSNSNSARQGSSTTKSLLSNSPQTSNQSLEQLEDLANLALENISANSNLKCNT
jgi:hypothetical protein